MGCFSLLLGCAGVDRSATTTPVVTDSRHLAVPAPAPKEDIPPLAVPLPLPPKPEARNRLDTYSVVVSNLEVGQLLFALARDAKLNIDLHPGVTGTVSINAINQTLPQILSRIARQVDMRYELKDSVISVLPDSPYLQHYQINYVNLSRESTASVAIATQVAAAGGSPAGAGTSTRGEGEGANNSTTKITTTSNHSFWTRLETNVRDLLRETDKILPGTSEQAEGQREGSTGSAGRPAGAGQQGQGSGSGSGSSASASGAASSGAATGSQRVTFREAASVIANPETGVLSVRATSRQHEKVQEFLDRVLRSAQRQVLIEATVVEVTLTEEFQQGINWQKLNIAGSRWAYTQQPGGPGPLGSGLQPGTGPGGMIFPPGAGVRPTDPAFTGLAPPSLGVLSYVGNSIAGAVSLLESFGRVRVLSSPRLSVLNNQSAVLKVVDNRVYFTISVNVTPGTDGAAPIVTYTSTPATVPVGFVMSVTPQIGESGMVSMNVRPTISRIIGYINDPNPALAAQNVVSRLPEIQTREIESLLRVSSGDIAVLGGLMQDSVSNQADGVPGAQEIPGLGALFRYRNDKTVKSELVILIRPVIVNDASLDGDYKPYRVYAPDADFFRQRDEVSGGRRVFGGSASILGGSRP
jgi:general secretion pathway protein D